MLDEFFVTQQEEVHANMFLKFEGSIPSPSFICIILGNVALMQSARRHRFKSIFAQFLWFRTFYNN